MASPLQTSKKITKNLTKLELSLKRKLLRFYNENIAGSVFPIESLRRVNDVLIANIIRKAVQDSYVAGIDTVGEQVKEKDPGFELFISNTDIQNIIQLTNIVLTSFWLAADRLLKRENEFKQIDFQPIQPKANFNAEATMLGIAVDSIFKPFNQGVKSKLPIVTALTPTTSPITAAKVALMRDSSLLTTDLPTLLDLPINFEIVREVGGGNGKIMFLTKEDQKVDPEICMPLNRTTYEAGDPTIPTPPLHKFCRCMLVPYVE